IRPRGGRRGPSARSRPSCSASEPPGRGPDPGLRSKACPTPPCPPVHLLVRPPTPPRRARPGAVTSPPRAWCAGRRWPRSTRTTGARHAAGAIRVACDVPEQLTVYGAPWCPYCHRTKRFRGAERVEFRYVDIDREPDAIEELQALQDGGRTIPTVVFPDGTHLVAPTDGEVASRLGLVVEAARAFYDLVIVGGG